MKSVFVTALALLQTIELSSASPESLLYPPSHRSLHARRLEVSRDSDSTRVLSALQAREDYTCGPGSELLLQTSSSTMLVHLTCVQDLAATRHAVVVGIHFHDQT